MVLGSSEFEKVSRAALFWFLCGFAVVPATLAGLARMRRAPQLLCVLAFFTVERLHARADHLSELASTAVPGGLHTTAWVGAAFVLFAAGFALRSSVYRWSAFGVLAPSVVRLLAVELCVLSPDQRIVTFVLAGVLLLLVSFLYTRSRERTS